MDHHIIFTGQERRIRRYLLGFGAALVLGLAILIPSQDVQAATCTWTSPNKGNWSDPNNWSTCDNQYPGYSPTDEAIISSGDVIVNIDVTIASLNFSGGTIEGTANLTTAYMWWTGGDLGSNNSTLDLSVATLRVELMPTRKLEKTTLTVTDTTIWDGLVDGTVTLNGSRLSLSTGSSVVIHAPFDLDATSDLELTQGSFHLSGGIASGVGGLQVGSAGTAPVVEFSGDIDLGEATFVSGTANFQYYTNMVGLGDVVTVSGGTVVLDSWETVRIGHLDLSAGTLGGCDAINVTGNLDWTGGTISCTGSPHGNITIGGALNVDSTSQKNLINRTMVVTDPPDWASTGTGTLTLENGSLSMRGGAAPGASVYGPVVLSTASQLILRGGTFALNAPLSGAGSITYGSVADVHVTITGSYTISGSSIFQQGEITFSPTTPASSPQLGDAILSGATLTLSCSQKVLTDSLSISSGTLTGEDDLETSGGLTWSGGSITSTASTNYPSLTAGSLSYTINSANTLEKRSMAINGPVAWTGTGTFSINSSMAINGPVTWTGTGTLSINSPDGVLDLSGSASAVQIPAGMTIDGGTLSGSDSLLLSGALTWRGGTISGTGDRPSLQAASLTFDDSSDWRLINRSLSTSSGNADWSGDATGTLTVDNSTLTLKGGTATTPEGPITLTNNSSLAFDGGSFTIDTSLSGTGLVVFGATQSTTVTFSGSYVYNLPGGSSTFTRGSVTFGSGGSPFDWGSTVTINGAAVQLNLDTTMGASSTINLMSGSLNGSGDLTGVEDFNWSGGDLLGTGGSIPVLETVNLSIPSTSGSDLALSGRSVSVIGPGVVDWDSAGVLTIGSNGSLDLDSGSQVMLGNITLNGGVISGTDQRTMASGRQLTWTTGEVQGTGSLVVPTNASLVLDGAGPRRLNTTLELAGTATWAGSGQLLLANGAVFENQIGATFTLSGTGDLSLEPTDSPGGSFSNAGTLVVQQGTHTARIGLLFDSPGAIRVENGTLLLDEDVDGSPTGTLAVSGGTLSGEGDIVGLASLSWTGGILTASSGTPTLSAASLTTSGSGPWELDNRLLTASGMTWSGTGTITLNASTLTLNGPAAFSTGGSRTITLNMSTIVLNGLATFNAGGTTTITGDGTLQVNAGLTQAAAASITFQEGAELVWGGGTLTGGTFTIAAGGNPASLVFSGSSPWSLSGITLNIFAEPTWPTSGELRLTQNSLLNVADFNPSLENLLIENSTLRGTGIITLTGSLDWQGGTIGPATGDLEIQAATLEVSTSGPWSLVNSTLTVTDATEWNSSSTGTFTLTGSSLSLVAGASAVSIPTNLSLNATSHLILEDGSFTLSGYIMSGNGEVRVGSASTTPVVDFSGYIQLGQSSFISGTTRFLPASTILSVGLGETVSVSGGTLELNNGDSISIPNLSLTAGTLTGLDSVTTSNMTWSGGKIACLSSMYVAYLDTGLSYPQLDGCRLTVANSWEGIGNVTLINNAQLILLTSISISSGVTTFSGSGTVSVGTMNLSSGSGITLAGGAELIWSGGSLTGGGAVTIESGSSLSFGYGQCTLQSDLIVFGSATWPTNHPLIIATGGTLDISSGSDQVMDQLDLAGGILQGSDDLTITTSLTWSSGTIGGVGELNLPDTVTLSLDGSGARTLDARALNLDGALNWTGSGNLTLRNGAMLTNQGEMTWTGLGTLYLENNAVLNNQGQLSFQGSAPKTITTHTSGEVVNAGVLSQTGSSTTTIDVAISSTGELSVTGGTLTLNSFSTASADASIAIDSGSALILSSIATASIDGPVTIDTGGMLRFYSGDFTLGSTSSLTGGGMVDFGSVRGSIHGTYNLTGTTRLTSTLSLPVTFTSQSHLLNPGSLIELNGTGFPTLVLDTGQPVTLTNLELKMGTLGGSDSVTVTGQFSWSGGTLSGSGATPPALNLPATAGLVYSGDAPHALNHRILNIAGPTDWSGVGSLHIGVTGRLNNLETAVMTIHHQSPTHLIISEVPAFTNRGKITISNSAGNSILSVPTTNTGTIEVQSGTLQINQDYVQSDGLLKLNGGGLLIGRAGQTLEIDGGRLQAIGNSTIDGHLHNIAGTISLGDLPRTPGKLTITGDYLQGPAGTLELYIQDSVNADLIEVGETAVFDGTLKMNRPSSYVPANGDQVVVMHYVSALGSFTNLEGSDLGSGLYLLPDYQNPIALTLKVTDTPSNLAITLDDGVDTVTPGMSLTYTIMITNNDLTHAAQAIRITGTFPAELANITWECNGPGGSCGSGSGNIDLILASLSAGGSATLTVHAAVAPGASGTINAIVSVACSGITKNAVDQDTISTVSQQKLYLPLTIR